MDPQTVPTIVAAVVGAVVGGLLTVAGTIVAERFARQRDAATRAQQLADSRPTTYR